MDLLDQPVGLRLADAEVEREVARPQAWQRQRQQVGRDGRDHPDPEAPGETALPAADLLDLADLVEDPPRPAQHLAAGGRDDQPARAALDQPGAERRLQLADLHRERRLADVDRGGGAAEVAGVRERRQESQLAEGELHNLQLSKP